MSDSLGMFRVWGLRASCFRLQGIGRTSDLLQISLFSAGCLEMLKRHRRFGSSPTQISSLEKSPGCRDLG